jgi:CRISPR system Cascade subunit CasE
VAEGGRPQFFVLSKTPPDKHHVLFATQSKEFNPKFYKGQRLAFKLRVNPTVCLKNESGKSKRHDVLMHAKYQARQEGITSQNQIKLLMDEAAKNWITNQKRLDEWGVTLDALPDIECYSQHKSEKKNHTVKFSSVDYQGILTITDPKRFSAQYEKGFGRAKAMGCGLMLVRPI